MKKRRNSATRTPATWWCWRPATPIFRHCAEAARVETAEAQMQTAQALYGKATDQQNAGLSPAIDTLRSQVEFQNRQQQLIVASNDLPNRSWPWCAPSDCPSARKSLLLRKRRTMRLPPWELKRACNARMLPAPTTWRPRNRSGPPSTIAKALPRNTFPLSMRPPTTAIWEINFGNSHGTFTVAGRLNIPIFQGGKVHADVLQSEATLRQARAQLDNLRGQIEYEIRTALLDIEAADQQVQVARSSVDLAEQTLMQARDRFSAGVTDNLEVVQAQQTVAGAHESYISSLYAHNLAKIELVRAMGYAEQGVMQYLKSK